MHPLPRLMAVFTPFGAQSFCNLEGFVEDHSIEQDDDDMYTAIEWGPEGYQLWLGTNKNLSMQSFIRSASCSSPIMVSDFFICKPAFSFCRSIVIVPS